jgi:hypothetical protein
MFLSNIIDSDNFSKNVVGWEELVILNNMTNLNMTDKQRRLYYDGAIPYYCINHKEKAWGFIKNENGNIVQSCRCERKECSHFNECMSTSYAKNIIRENNYQSKQESNIQKIPEWKTNELLCK